MAKTVGGLADLKSITSEELESMSISELLASRTGAYRAANRIYSRLESQGYEYAQSQIEKPATYRPPTQRQISKYSERQTENLRNKLISNIQQLQGVVNQPLLSADDWRERQRAISEEDERLRELEVDVREATGDDEWSILEDYSKKSGWVDKAVSMGMESEDAKVMMDHMDPESKSFKKFSGLVVKQLAEQKRVTSSYTTPNT